MHAHAALVKMLFMVIIIASVYTSVFRAARICRSGVVWPGCQHSPYTASPAPVPPRPRPWLLGRLGIHAAVHRHRALSVGWRCIACWRVLAMQYGIAVCGPWSGAAPWPRPPSPRGERAGTGLLFQRDQPLGGRGSCWGSLPWAPWRRVRSSSRASLSRSESPRGQPERSSSRLARHQ